MTLPLPAADQLFRKALDSLKAYPIDRGRKPAFALPRATPRVAAPAEGPVTGPAHDLWSAATAVREGRQSVIGLAEASAARIGAFDRRFGAFEHVADISEAARRREQEARAGDWRGPLHGIPISVKDIIDVAAMPTTGSSVAVASYTATADATAVRRLREAGALIAGKTVTHEFALGVTTPQSRNPWDETRVPGGSSGGSVISVVTGMALGSLGTDTRASIRVPAALSAAVGYRPTTGLVPVDGWLTLSWSLDVLAPMGRSVRDIALLMDVLTDSGSAYRDVLPGSLTGRTVGYSELLWGGIEPGVRACFEDAMAAVERAGGAVVRLDGLTSEDVELANYAGMVLSRVEAAHFHAQLGTELGLCTPEVRDQLAQASEVLATDYVRCLRLRGQLYERFLDLFSTVDLLMMPTAEVVAPKVEEASRFLLVLSENCIPWSLVDFPAISLYSGMSEGLPTGVQLVAPAGHDAFLLNAAHALERELPPLPEWQP